MLKQANSNWMKEDEEAEWSTSILKKIKDWQQLLYHREELSGIFFLN